MFEADRQARREIDQLVRQLVIRHFVNNACAPAVAEISRDAGASIDETRDSLQRIAQPGLITLLPSRDGIWVANPFTADQSVHSVVCGRQRYSAPCAMCALGIAALVDGDVDIHSQCGDCGRPLHFEIRSSRIHGDGVVHCLLPPSHWFDTVGFSCHTTLFFASEQHAHNWCEQRHVTPGGMAPVTQFFEAATRMVRGRLSSGWQVADHDLRAQTFRAVGLDSEFWQTSRLARPIVKGEQDQRVCQPAPPAAIENVKLTDRELEVLNLLADARSQKQIAGELLLSVHTVDTHIRNIYTKLQAHSRAAAVAAALRGGLI